MYASGRTTGITIDIGEGLSFLTSPSTGYPLPLILLMFLLGTHQVLPIFEGYGLWAGATRRNFGGYDITNILLTQMKNYGLSFSNSSYADYFVARYASFLSASFWLKPHIWISLFLVEPYGDLSLWTTNPL
jgi:hypothetical protein